MNWTSGSAYITFLPMDIIFVLFANVQCVFQYTKKDNSVILISVCCSARVHLSFTVFNMYQ